MVKNYIHSKGRIASFALAACMVSLLLISNHGAFALAPSTPTIKSPITGSMVLTNSFTVTGTADPNVDVELLDENNNFVGAGTSGSSGFWTIDTLEIPNGSHTIFAQTIDSNGDVSTSSSGTIITVSSKITTTVTSTTTLPAAPIITTIPANLNAADNTPTIKGTAEVGVTVTLFDENNNNLGFTATDGIGNWEISIATESDGTHTITAKATNTFGTSGSSSPISITINTSGGVISVSTPTITTSSGSIPDDTPVITGTADPGNMISLLDENSLQVGSGITPPSGKWSITTTSLSSGSHSISAQATDSSGSTSALSSSITLTIKTSLLPPTPVIQSPEDGSTEDILTPSMSGTAFPGDKILLYDGSTKMTTTPSTIIVDSDGNWFASPSSALSVGDHSIKAKAVRGGTESMFSTSVVVTLSAGATISLPTTPVITQPGVLNTNPQTISGTGGAGDVISLFDEFGNGIGDTTADSSGAWSVSVPLADGSHSITATDSNSRGISYSVPVTVQVITSGSTIPSAPVIVSRNTFDTTSPTISGTASSGVLVELFDGSTLIGSTLDSTSGEWSIDVTLSGGSHTLTAKATNAAGTSPASSPLIATILTVPSAPSITTSGTLSSATPTITGTAGVNLEVALFDENGNDIGTTVSDKTTGAWSITASSLGNGPHTLFAQASNFIGTSDDSAPASITILVAGAPAVPVITPPQTFTTSTPMITGTATVGLTVTLFNQNGNNVGSGTATGGSWSITTSPLANGFTTLTAKVTSGGLTSSSAGVGIIIDVSTAPNTPFITTTSNANFNTQTPVISGTADPGVTINLFDGTTNIGSTTSDAVTGEWSITTNVLSNGIHTLTAQASSSGGLSDTSGMVDIIISLPGIPSIPSITTDSGSLFTTGMPTIKGTSGPGATINLFDENNNFVGSGTAGSNGLWTITTSSLSNGFHQIGATATNGTGTSSESDLADILVNISGPPPAPIVTTPNGFSFSTSTPTITGTSEPGLTVTVLSNGTSLGTTTADSQTGVWVFTLPSSTFNGTRLITATVLSIGGVTSPSYIATTIATTTTPLPSTVTAPSNITPPDGTTITDATPTISGTADPGDVIKLTDGGVLVGAGVADSTGSWSVTTTQLDPGAHTISIQASNPAGTATTTITLTR